MAISEQARHQMYMRLEAMLGPAEAATLMEHLPPVGWADVATRHDLDTLRADMRAGFAELRGELRGEIGELRGELRGETGNLRGEIGELRGEIGSLRGELHSQLRSNLVAAVTANAAVVGIAAGLAGLF